MKTFLSRGSLTILLAVLPFFISCTDLLDQLGFGSAVPFEEPKPQRMAVLGEIQADHAAFFLTDGNQSITKKSFIYGSGFLDHEGLIPVSCRHTHITIGESAACVRIVDGNFEFILDRGDILFGVYDGYGSCEQGNVNLELQLNITGGTGDYEDASGNIRAAVITSRGSSSSGLCLDLAGVILVKRTQI
ncbi:MAG: hypothetical protein KFF73_12500 [Cyclobacteriaceae bacterium]|nr:hypothetical protein [Cyclobacteriaceae bacterium]